MGYPCDTFNKVFSARHLPRVSRHGYFFLYGKKDELLAEVKPERRAPMLNSGDNAVEFSRNAAESRRPRTRVTVIAAGEFLEVD